jgi:hypothetical protein
MVTHAQTTESGSAIAWRERRRNPRDSWSAAASSSRALMAVAAWCRNSQIRSRRTRNADMHASRTT